MFSVANMCVSPEFKQILIYANICVNIFNDVDKFVFIPYIFIRKNLPEEAYITYSSFVCMYVRVYVCMYVCMCVCMCVYICMYVCMYV